MARFPMRLLPDDNRIGWSPYAWLVYLLFLLLEIVFAGSTLFNWSVIAVSLAVFFPLYFRFYWERGWRAQLCAAGIGALGLVAMPFNGGGGTFVIYSAALLGWSAQPRTAFRWLALLLAATIGEAWLLDLPFYAWLPGMTGIIAVGCGNIHFAEIHRKNEVVRRAQQEVEQLATVAERERIARDLHDLLGHTLSVIAMKSELASKLADRDPARAIQEIRDVERVSREALTEVRRAVEGYQQRGFAGELQNAASALRSAGVSFEADCAAIPLPPRQETALALALREAVTNVVRHARATSCRVALRPDGRDLVFTVHDNGRGGVPHEGSGLNGMRSRITQAGGTLVVDGSDGMRVIVRLPLKSQEVAIA
jgi:two-component system, NarL family, sensor histidine kinase DesK